MRIAKALSAALAVTAASLLFSGCATEPSLRPQDTSVLGGLYASQPGKFDQQTSTGIPLNSNKPSRTKKMSGDKVSILWGLFTIRDQ